MYTSGDWQLSKTDVFWGEVASEEHVVQLYDNEDAFLDMLAGFAGSGFNAGDSVILIATASHLETLAKRMKAHGIHVDSLIANNQYIPLEAEQTLSKLLNNGRPDEQLFMQVVGDTIKRAKKNNRKVRAFGEMVAILWERGEHEATIELEQLWNKFCGHEALTRFCAFPRNAFDNSPYDSIPHICSCYAKIIESSPRAMVEVLYRPTHVATTV
jgi:hypothetical protein